jgi:putative DNA primase/helicase
MTAEKGLKFDPGVEWEPLTERDFDSLEKSGIPAQLAIDAQLYRVGNQAGAFIVGRQASQIHDMSGLAYPNIWPGERFPRETRLRRDNPEMRRGSDGKPKADRKYLTAPGARNHLYIGPGIDPAWLQDVTIPIIITEGEKKDLALTALALHEHAGKPRWISCAISGVWNFRDNSEKGFDSKGARVSVNAPISDLSRVAWEGRAVTIVFDSNTATNPGVLAARNQFALELTGRGALVSFVDIPQQDGINGIDDFIAAHGPAEALELLGTARPFDPKEKLAKLCYTDHGHEQAFEMLFADRYLYHATGGVWLVWNGVVFEPDELNRIDRDMLQVALARLDATVKTEEDPLEFKKTGDPRKSTKGAIAAAMKLQNVRGRQAALESATSNPRFARRAEHFDQHDLLFACANGVIDLETGELRPGRREDMLTLQSDVVFDARAECRDFLRFLDGLFPHNPELIEFLQVAIGYSLTGLTREEIFLILHGLGRNGKGTLLRVMLALFGRYGATTEFSTLIQDRDVSKSPRNDIAAIAGKRLVSAQESRRGAQLDESLIKSLTGGDMITARFLHKEFFTFRPTWKIWLATNHKPQISGSDVGIWSRPKLIPFNETFEGREDKGLKDRLLAPSQLSGVLNWAVAGAVSYLRNGLKYPEIVTAATKSYKHEQDIVSRFLDECCRKTDPGLSIKAHDLFVSFAEWVRENELEAMSEVLFSAAMKDKGILKARGGKGQRYFGIAIDPEKLHAFARESEEAEAIRTQDIM